MVKNFLIKILCILIYLVTPIFSFTSASDKKEDRPKCMIGEKEWSKDGIEICENEFTFSAFERVDNGKIVIPEYHVVQCDLKELKCDDSEEYQKKIEERFIISFDGVSSAKFENYKDEIDELDTTSVVDKKTGNEINFPYTRAYKRLNTYDILNKEIKDSSTVLYTDGPLKNNESFEVGKAYFIKESVKERITLEEVRKRNLGVYEFFNSAANTFDFIDFMEVGGFHLYNGYKSKKPNFDLNVIGIMIDPEGTTVYSWKKAGSYGCREKRYPLVTTKINGYLAVFGEHCKYSIDVTLPFLLIKAKNGKYYSYEKEGPWLGC